MNKVYLLRHGENVANLTKEFSHRKVDYSLTPKGRLQAGQAAAFFLDQQIQAIFSSPLKRARETAAIIASALGLETTVIEDFRELNVGDLEDPPVSDEKWRIHHGVWFEWLSGNRAASFPGGENHFQACARMRRGLATALAGRAGQRLVIAGHGGLFMSTLGETCPRLNLAEILAHASPNGSLSEGDFTWDGQQWTGELVRWAATDHLHGAAADFVNGYPDLKED